MNCSPSIGFTWLVTVVLAFAVGCGGSDETSPADDGGTADAAASQAAGDLPKPGEPSVDSPQVDPPEADPRPRVEFQTTEGNFTVTLRRDLVPGTVDNFLKYVNGFYDNTIFHEVTPDYAIVGGSFTESDEGTFLEKDTLPAAIRSEAANGLPNQRGTIAMAREPHDIDSACSQFFINLGDNSGLNYSPPEDGVDLWQTEGYCAFGTVDEADWPVLDRIANKLVTSRNNRNHWPVDTIKIILARKL